MASIGLISVSSIEPGGRELSLGEWLWLPIGLETNHKSLIGALPTDKLGVVALAPDLRLYDFALQSVLSANLWGMAGSERSALIAQIGNEMDCPTLRTIDMYQSVEAASRQAVERKAAAQLRVSRTVVAMAAQTRWGSSLTIQRDILFSSDPSNATLSRSGRHKAWPYHPTAS